MAKDAKLRESVEALAPGEQVLAAVCVQPKGQGNAGAVGGIAGAVMAGRSGKQTAESVQATGIEIPRFAALAITPQRLLILKMNAMGSKADQIVSSVPIACSFSTGGGHVSGTTSRCTSRYAALRGSSPAKSRKLRLTSTLSSFARRRCEKPYGFTA